jgi:hypothetical protein
MDSHCLTGGYFRVVAPKRRRFGRIWRRGIAGLASALCVVAIGISVTYLVHPNQPGAQLACSRRPAATTFVASGPAETVAAGVASQLLKCAPAVVVANADSSAAVSAAAAAARQAHAPLLLSSPAQTTSGTVPVGSRQADLTSSADAVTLQEINDLHAAAVLAVGLTAGEISADLPGAQVTTNRAGFASLSRPAPLGHVVVLVPAGDPAVALAATATAKAAGATVVPVRGDDPRGDPAAIAAIDAAQPRQVIAAGSGFGPASLLASRLAVVMTGVQLPGGGQLVVPMHRIVALYGDPGVPGLGVLGQQCPAASVVRAEQVAAPYQGLSTVPVVPAFELIATVAQAAPGSDGSYSSQTPAASLLPWVRAATGAGMYVILDLQPGRASLLAQAQTYQSLLRLPNVGLALDPEWKLQPGELPLHQIGSVSIAEVNSVVGWLAQLTAQYRLPQKLLVLHEFKLGEIQDLQGLDTSSDDLAIVIDMDGQGSPPVKQQTWHAITADAPPGVPFGWKNFYVKDQPMLSPAQTMANSPQPAVISYE